MAFFDNSNPKFTRFIRKLLPSDWAHADVVNTTLAAMVGNELALSAANSRIDKTIIPAAAWSEKSYQIHNGNIKPNSIVDIYYAKDSKEAVMDAEIEESIEEGTLIFTCATTPKQTINIDCIEIRNEVVMDAG